MEYLQSTDHDLQFNGWENLLDHDPNNLNIQSTLVCSRVHVG
jgi:hypothetical protein